MCVVYEMIAHPECLNTTLPRGDASKGVVSTAGSASGRIAMQQRLQGDTFHFGWGNTVYCLLDPSALGSAS